MKKITLVMVLAFLFSAMLFGKENGRIHCTTIPGIQTLGRIDGQLMDAGLSLGQEVTVSIGKFFRLGPGFRYFFSRETNDDSSLSWIPIYANFEVFVPVKSKIPLFLKTSFGYSLIHGDSLFTKDKEDLRGGLYFYFGGGTEIPLFYTDSISFSLVFHMGYSSHAGTYTQDSKNKTLRYTAMDTALGFALSF